MRGLSYLASLAIVLLLSVNPALAEQAAEATASAGGGLNGIAAGIAIAIAAFGGAFGQAKAASTALEGISRNPGAAGQMFLPMILGFVFIETLVLFSLDVALKLAGLF